MDDKDLEGLIATDAPAAEPQPAPEPEPAPEPVAEGPARGPDGKFTAKQAEPAPAESGHVPISAMLDERDKRQALEKQLAAMRAQQAPPPPLDPVQDLEVRLYSQRLDMSRYVAEQKYGPELTQTVHDWAAKRCDEDPVFNEQMRSSKFPYEAAMQAYNRDQIAAKVTPDRLAAFEAWEAAQAEVQAQQPSALQPAAQTPLPRSLANAPGNGAAGAPHTPTGPGEAFNAVIPR